MYVYLIYTNITKINVTKVKNQKNLKYYRRLQLETQKQTTTNQQTCPTCSNLSAGGRLFGFFVNASFTKLWKLLVLQKTEKSLHKSLT